MREMISLFMAVFMFSAVSGGVLATVQKSTAPRIKQQVLQFVIGPAIDQIFEGADNKPLEDLFIIEDGDKKRDVFVAEMDGKRDAVAFEAKGKGGYGGDVGVIVAVNVKTDEIIGVAVTTHSETAGMGSRAKDDPVFCNQFVGTSLKESFQVKPDGGAIDALSGATITSRAVCRGVTEASDVYSRFKDEILKKL